MHIRWKFTKFFMWCVRGEKAHHSEMHSENAFSYDMPVRQGCNIYANARAVRRLWRLLFDDKRTCPLPSTRVVSSISTDFSCHTSLSRPSYEKNGCNEEAIQLSRFWCRCTYSNMLDDCERREHLHLLMSVREIPSEYFPLGVLVPNRCLYWTGCCIGSARQRTTWTAILKLMIIQFKLRTTEDEDILRNMFLLLQQQMIFPLIHYSSCSWNHFPRIFLPHHRRLCDEFKMVYFSNHMTNCLANDRHCILIDGFDDMTKKLQNIKYFKSSWN